MSAGIRPACWKRFAPASVVAACHQAATASTPMSVQAARVDCAARPCALRKSLNTAAQSNGMKSAPRARAGSALTIFLSAVAMDCLAATFRTRVRHVVMQRAVTPCARLMSIAARINGIRRVSRWSTQPKAASATKPNAAANALERAASRTSDRGAMMPCAAMPCASWTSTAARRCGTPSARALPMSIHPAKQHVQILSAVRLKLVPAAIRMTTQIATTIHAAPQSAPLTQPAAMQCGTACAQASQTPNARCAKAASPVAAARRDRAAMSTKKSRIATTQSAACWCAHSTRPAASTVGTRHA